MATTATKMFPFRHLMQSSKIILRPFSSSSTATAATEINKAPEPYQQQQKKQQGPKKESLLAIDWILEGLAPQFFKARLQPIFEKMDSEVEFVDEIFGYKKKGVDELGMHITKVRGYFRWKSPYNKVAHKGSYLFEDEDYVAMIWGIETINSSFMAYFPSFITGKQTPMRYLDGTLHFTVNPDGKIIKIVNRKTTDKDVQLAKEFGELKKSENERHDKEDRKAAETELKEKIERQDL